MARTKGSEDLYQLIHSLTAEEKGYFKKFAKRHTAQGKKYLELFDAVNAQKEFEEALLKKKFKGYADMKIYLRHLITDALTLYMSHPENPVIHLAMLLSRAAILERKGLTKLAIQEIKKAMVLAQQNDQPFFEHWFASRYRNLQTLSMAANEKYLYEQKMNDKLTRLLQIQISNDRFVFERKKMTALFLKNLRQADVAISEKDIDFEYFNNANNALSDFAKKYRFNGLVEYYHHLKQTDKEYKTAMEYLKFSKLQFEKSKDNAAAYSNALMFAGRACAGLKKTKDAEQYYTEMLHLKTANGRFNKTVITAYVRYMFMLYIENNLFAEGKVFLDKALLLYPSAFANEKQNFYYDTNVVSGALIRFAVKDYRGLVATLNQFDKKIIQLRSPVYLRDAELMRLMIQVELKNYELLPALLKSAIAKLKKMKMYGDYERTLMRFFIQVNENNLRKTAREYFELLKNPDTSKFSNRLTNLLFGDYAIENWFKNLAEGKR